MHTIQNNWTLKSNTFQMFWSITEKAFMLSFAKVYYFRDSGGCETNKYTICFLLSEFWTQTDQGYESDINHIQVIWRVRSHVMCCSDLQLFWIKRKKCNLVFWVPCLKDSGMAKNESLHTAALFEKYTHPPNTFSKWMGPSVCLSVKVKEIRWEGQFEFPAQTNKILPICFAPLERNEMVQLL